MSIPPSPYTDMLDSGPIPSVTQTTLLPSWPKRKLLPNDSGEVASLMERITNKSVQKKKAKGDAAELNSDTVFSIMKELELVHIPVEKENGDLSCMHEPVNRDFLSNVFGGSKVGAYPTPALDKVKMHNIKCFLCPNLDFNPRAAQMPGAPGLMFHFGTRLLKRGDRLIIPNIMEKTKGVHPTFPGIGTSKWLYVGHYRLIDGRALSPQEFCQQTQAVGYDGRYRTKNIGLGDFGL
ncbi:hypothetical protein DFH11DRAFT_1601819 [Phellopilus nigrolimitatus]|nr:hypothetical protein DFH11DRAFT_1601819 [Phellopilus nigrolimitatus]